MIMPRSYSRLPAPWSIPALRFATSVAKSSRLPYSFAMKTIATAIPDDLAPHQGEEIQFNALVQEDGTFLVTRIIHRQPPAVELEPKMTLSEWTRKWGGTMKLEPGQTYEDLKRAAYKKKFGL